MKNFALAAILLASVNAVAQDMSHAEDLSSEANMSIELQEDSALEELNPYAADIEEQLTEMDEAYERATGLSAFLESAAGGDKSGCSRSSCKVWLDVNKSTQRARILVDGVVKYSDLKISSGAPAHPTPNFETHPNGRIYDRYSSSKFPGGDYNGLGNMPFAVFIRGGFAVHGTPRSNWPKLGTRASHGCIRIHPDNARIFNRLVRSVGVAQTWISVHN